MVASVYLQSNQSLLLCKFRSACDWRRTAWKIQSAPCGAALLRLDTLPSLALKTVQATSRARCGRVTLSCTFLQLKRDAGTKVGVRRTSAVGARRGHPRRRRRTTTQICRQDHSARPLCYDLCQVLHQFVGEVQGAHEPSQDHDTQYDRRGSIATGPSRTAQKVGMITNKAQATHGE